VLLTSGVTSGQTIVTAGVHVLNPGQHVSILEADAKPVGDEPYLSSQNLLTPVATTPPADSKATKAQGASK
jgi:tetraacyldisaccharide-1-P 4'-kinase